MLFVVTTKWNPENMAEFIKVLTEAKVPKEAKVIGVYALLGRCQMVSIIDASDEKTIFKMHQPYAEIAECD